MDQIDALFPQMGEDERRRLILGNLLMGVSGGLLGARKGQELQGLGFGLLGGAANAQNALGQAQQANLDRLKARSYGMDYLAKKTQFENDQRESALEANYQPQPPTLPDMAPTPANAAALAAQPKMGLYEQLMARAEYFAANNAPKKAAQYREEALKHAPKYKGMETVMDPATGQPVLMQMYENQAPTRSSYAPKPDMVSTDLGGQVVWNDKLRLQPGQSFAKTMTPEGADASKRGWASQGLEREKFNYQKSKDAQGGGPAKPQWDATTGQFVYPPDVANPTGRAVKPEGYTPKPPEHTRRELDTIDAQIGIIQGARDAASKTPGAFGFTRGLATMAGTIPESLASKASSPEARQARAYVFNVVSSAINERAGAAQSVQELARLRSFLPAETDGQKEVDDKLKGFEQYLQDKRKAYAGGGGKAKTVNFADLPQ